ncbi:MAG: hypothetical protein AAF926_05470 [Pseudomonadota bacterium]
MTPTVDNLIDSVTDLLDGGRADPQLQSWLDAHDAAQAEVDDFCVFTQTQRVLDVCEKAAQEDNVSIIAVNLSGEGGDAETVTQECLRAASGRQGANRGRPAVLPDFNSLPTKRLANGLTVTFSEDGQSMYAPVETLDDLRHVLSSTVPEARHERTVRLVH